MRAMITGGEGFAGRWLRAWLNRCGDEVFAPNVDVTQRHEVLEAVIATRPDAVFHLAAVSVPAFAQADPEQAMLVNAGGTRNVLDATGTLDDPPVVLVTSSAAVYRHSDAPLTEDSPTGVDGAYVQSKLAAEEACAAAVAAGRRVIVARPFNHTGPRQASEMVVPALASGILDAIAKGRSVVEVGNLEVRRDIADVRDVVRGYRLLAELAPGATYNICTGKAVALREVAETLAELANAPTLSFRTDPSRLRADDAPVVVGSSSRLETVTGWRPEVGLRTTLADVLAWWKARA